MVFLISQTTNEIKAYLIAVQSNMADVFLTEDYEGVVDENKESVLFMPSSEIKVVVKDSVESQDLLNNDSEEADDCVEDSTDMTLKQGASEPELFESEDLLVNPDDLLPPVMKLEKYANSDLVFNRQVVARNLLETLRLVQGNQDEVDRVINVLCSISEDYDPSVRTELMVQLPHIAEFCKEAELNNTIVQYLVPMLISYLGDENNLVRKSSHSTLLSMVEEELIDFNTVSEKICPLILHLTDSIHPEDLRTESIVLMSKLVVLMGRKAAEELFFERLFALCVDKSNNIRKACALTFGDLCTTVGRETTEEVLLPKFFALCEDSAWGVRKACAENFMPVSCVVSRETRRKELSNIYMILLSDQSRWVRLTAYQALGPVISTYAEPERTGLYYSKDGVLTIVDTPNSLVPDINEKPVSILERNGMIDAVENLKCTVDVEDSVEVEGHNDNSNIERTSSSKSCDSIVPLSSDVPCHVGNYCTVIEVSSSNMTSSDRTPGDTISVGCDPEHSIGNDRIIIGSCNGEDVNVTSNTFDQDANFVRHLDENEEYNKMWLEAICWSDELLANGALDRNGGEGAVQKNFDIHVHGCNLPAKEKCAVLSSVTVNGINVSSSVALAEPMNCEAIPVINCSKSVKESGSDSKESPDSLVSTNETQHSSSSTQSVAIPTLVFTAQELNHATTDISGGGTNILHTSETIDKESAFNHFQYWRNPLPDIDVDAVLKDSRDSSANDFSTYLKRTVKVYNSKGLSHDKIFRIESWYLRDMTKKAEDLASENKGEPPPGTKILRHDDQDIVPPELLLQYLSMIDSTWAQTIDAEIARHCAYSLPAVALTLGRQYWPCLKETFDALSSDLQGFIMMWKVRRTVASAMHQLAVILGPDITSRDLLPVFSRFITDLDEVRVGILQHLYDFLKVLRPEERKQFLPSLPEFLVQNNDSDSHEKNWRFRLVLAEQLVSIAELYEPQQVKDHLVPLSLTLIKDKICEVRLAAVRVMAAVMRRLSQNPTPVFTKAVLSELTEKFVHSPKWLYRQLYVYICQEFIVESSLSPDQFAEDALPQLLYLCWDRVPNVRIAIARCLVAVIWPLDIFSNHESPHRELLLQTIHTLQSDIDADVRFYANTVSTHECSCLLNGEFTNVVEPFV